MWSENKRENQSKRKRQEKRREDGQVYLYFFKVITQTQNLIPWVAKWNFWKNYQAKNTLW